MARVALTNQQAVSNKVSDVTHKIKHDLWEAGISQQAVADAAGISQPSVANQFRRGQLTLTVYLAAQMLLEKQ